MSTLLKDLYSREFYQSLADVLAITLPDFEQDKFTREIFAPHFESLELKQRMAHTADVLHRFLGDDYAVATASICRLIDNLRAQGITEKSLEYMFLPDYIERYGIDDYATSVNAIEVVTQYTSCEYAVRPFILRYGERMLAQMLAWSKHEHNMVRRLASEGTRPRLPWAMALPGLKRDPAPILAILENLKSDPCEIVRRSVANSLNDISRDNPEVTLELTKKWRGRSAETDALLKHGCRTLLKQGQPEVMKLFGFDAGHFELADFRLLTPALAMGETLDFRFSIANRSRKQQPLRLEYALYFLRQNGQHNKKVFKISERELGAGESLRLEKRHRFKPITTRRYYAGQQAVSIIVNGRESEIVEFELEL